MTRAGRQLRISCNAVMAVAGAHRLLTALTLSYLVGFASMGLGIGSDLAVSYLLVVSLLVVAVARLEERFHLGAAVLWAFSLWGLAHMAGGIAPLGGGRILYNAWLVGHLVRYDQAVHAVGFGFATVACGKVLARWLPAGAATGPAVLAALAGMGVGAMNEVVEFLATLVLAQTHVGGFENTGWDLVFNLIGATTAAVWLAGTWSAPATASSRSNRESRPAMVGR